MKISRASSGFTLIEMIGVLAVMAILATVMVPNGLHMIERAAVRAEADTLRALGGQIMLYVRDNAAQPTPANWNNQLATYSTLSAADILINKRQTTIQRLYVPDPNPPNQRVMLFSSMRSGVPLASIANIQASFQAIWAAQDGTVPPGLGWGAWYTLPTPGNIEYLVIERINLAPVYRNELQAYTVTLNNASGSSASYQILRANGTIVSATVTSPSHPTLPLLYPRDRLNLFNTTGILNYTYVISNSGKTFTFDGTNWILP